MKIPFLSKISWNDVSAKLADDLNVRNSSSSKLVAFLLLFFCLGLNVYLRLSPAYFPIFKQDAVLNVIDQYSGMISKESKSPQAGITVETLGKVQELIRKDPKAFGVAVSREYAKIRDPYQDEKGLTYLMEYDPYAWARWTENVVRNGHPGDKIVNGKSYDSFMLAPLGSEVYYFRFMFYLSAFLYRAANVFLSTLSLKQFLFYVPVFYAACFLLVFYLFVRSRATDLVAFLAVFLVGLTGECLQRGSAGWYDFDMLNLMMPLIVAACLLGSLRPGKRWRDRILLAGFAAFFEGVYAMTWSGWPVMLLIIAGFFVTVILAGILEKKKPEAGLANAVLPYLICGGVFFVLAITFVYLFIGDYVSTQVTWLTKSLRLGSAIGGGGDIWPNVLFTISELTSLSISGIASRFYGPWIFFASVLAVPIVIFKDWKTERRDTSLLMFCWLLVMAVASFKSNRFIIYLSVPFFYFFALLMGEYAPAFVQEKLSGLKRIAGALIYFVLVGLVAHTVFKSGVAYAESLKPLMNDAWHDALVFVDKNTPKDAILNSWWDRGSWFRYYGNRGVIFDGQSQQGQIAYWMAKVLLEKDEEKAARILRMMNNENGKTYGRLLETIKDPFRCEAVLEKLLDSKRPEAKKILAENGIPAGESRKILEALFAKPAPAYFIVEDSFFGKMPNISFLGNWDFRRLYAFQNPKASKEELIAGLQRSFGDSAEDAEKIARARKASRELKIEKKGLSKRYFFYTEAVKSAREGEMVYFDYGLAFNPRTQDALLYSAEDRKYKIPKKVILLEDGRFREIEKENANDSRVVLLTRQGSEYRSLLADEELIKSLFVKLFFMNGKNLNRFKPFYADEKNQIYIYEIVWD